MTFTIVVPNGSTGFPNPFSSVASIAVGQDSYWYTDGRSPALHRYSPSGELLQSVDLPVEPQSITSADRAEFRRTWLDNSTGDNRRRREIVADEAVYPEHFPLITDLLLSDDGTLWCGMYVSEGDSGRVWHRVSASGDVLDSVMLPAGATVHDVRESRLLVSLRDELGVERVAVLELTHGS